MRGTPFVQVPTTLTAQVDASIGGKTAVNLPEGKNLVGAFHQPCVVLSEISALASLPDRSFRAGLGEVAKYALTLDVDLLEQLERDPWPDAWLGIRPRSSDSSPDALPRRPAPSPRTSATPARRLVLNYGHTLGHALERLDAFAGRTHGEAIAAGWCSRRGCAKRGGSVRKGSRPGRSGSYRPWASTRPVRCHRPETSSTRSRWTRSSMTASASSCSRMSVARRIVDRVPPDEVRRVLHEMGAPV